MQPATPPKPKKKRQSVPWVALALLGASIYIFWGPPARSAEAKINVDFVPAATN